MKPCKHTHSFTKMPMKSAFGDYEVEIEELKIVGVFGHVSLSKINSFSTGGYWSVNYGLSRTTLDNLLFKPTKNLDEVVDHFNNLHLKILGEWL